ncbi:hypothetical protein [Pedobacter faecalis]|uniref:hypothetical protein n=1 Tax=Pedobacter faecalis TaxID=3041495 RepID=UPI00254D0DDA|nr:hypothetical protein [Pedobacter sp. ELA7]
MKFSSKLLLGLLSAFLVALTYRRLASKYISDIIPLHIIHILAYLPLLTALIIVFIWQTRENKGLKPRYELWFRQVMAFSLGVDLAMFGLQKLQKLQMIVPLGKLDEPFSSFSGYDLVWAFFRYSYPFTSVVAILQIASAALILFGRTRLLGCLIALPLLVFITLVDLFYAMPAGVLLHGAVFLTAVVYFICTDATHLWPLLLNRSRHSVTPLKWLWPVLFILVLLFCTIRLRHPNRHPELTGKYRVEHLTINGIAYQAKSSTDSVLTHVYLDLDNEVVFKWNDYRRQRIGHYALDGNRITMKWQYPASATGAFKGNIRQQGERLHLDGVMDGQRFTMLLIK